MTEPIFGDDLPAIRHDAWEREQIQRFAGASHDSLVDHIFNQVRSEMTARYGTPHNDTTRKQALRDALTVIDAVTVEVWVGPQPFKRHPADHHRYVDAITKLLEET